MTAVDPRFAALNPLVGRIDELEAVRARLAEARLVTLTGPGGAGKTRLAVEIAVERTATFIELTALRDATLVLPEIAVRIDAPGRAGESPASSIARAISGRPALIILDNVEQIEGIASPLGELLMAADGLTILATSRAPVGLPGEAEVRVAPLGLPSTDDPEAVLASDAGALFVRLAQRAGRLALFDEPTSRDVAELCRRLDGLPLALELAASRLRLFSLGAILRRLDTDSAVLSQSAGGRHGSLEVMFDWYLGMLTDEQRRVLVGVSRCRGGFDLDAARALFPETDVIGLLETMVSLGLVRVGEDGRGEPRFTLLETVRLAAGRRLAEDDGSSLRKRHASYFLEIVDRLPATLTGEVPREIAIAIDRDRDNVRTALDYLEEIDPVRALQTAVRLTPYWRTRGWLREGISRLERLTSTVPRPEVARGLAALAMLKQEGLGPTFARPQADQAVIAAEEGSDDGDLMEALTIQALVTSWTDPAASVAAAERAASLAGTRGEVGYPIRLQLTLGMAAWGRNDPRAAREHWIRASEVADEVGDLHFKGVAAGNMAEAGLALGDTREARRYASIAADAFLQTDEPLYLSWVLCLEAIAEARLGRLDEAKAKLIRGTETTSELHSPYNVKVALAASVALLVRVGEVDLAARACGAARVVCETHDIPPIELDEMNRDLQLGRAITGDTVVEHSIRSGRQLDPEKLLSQIQARLKGSAVRSAPSRARHGEHALTEREREVLVLLANGATDSDIAESLVISPKTASVHVSNLKVKLGVRTRLEAGLRARDMGLADQAG